MNNKKRAKILMEVLTHVYETFSNTKKFIDDNLFKRKSPT